MRQLSGDLVRHKLATRTFGQNIIYAQQTGSTNTELKRFARLDAPEGMVYVADEQLVGRGRLKRSWYAPPGTSLLVSVLFRPGDFLKPAQAQQLNMLCALAGVEAITSHTGLVPDLKWPNDIIWADKKKLGGLLPEAEIKSGYLSWVVVGLGLNVNINFKQAANQPVVDGQPLEKTATSLAMILGEDADHLRLPLLQSYLKNVEGYYNALKAGHSPQPAWEARLVGRGEPVTVTILNGAHQYTGLMTGVDKNGALCLRQADGTEVTILSGDVTLR